MPVYTVTVAAHGDVDDSGDESGNVAGNVAGSDNVGARHELFSCVLVSSQEICN